MNLLHQGYIIFFSEDKHYEIQTALAYLNNCNIRTNNLRAEDHFFQKQYVSKTRSRSFERKCANAQRFRMCRLRKKNGNESHLQLLSVHLIILFIHLMKNLNF